MNNRIKKELGSFMLFNYYYFIKAYCREPIDLVDFFDGTTALTILVELETPRL